MGSILYTSAEVRRAIIRLFLSSKKRRIAISAFVGEGAEAYLPKPKGLRLVCWPKAGGTNPNALRKLKQLGVKVDFAEKVHMKVYWTEDEGAVVTSANLSTNALGAGDLKEVGVLLAPGEFDIDRVISSLKLRPWSAAEIRKLDRQHRLYAARNRQPEEKSRKPSFAEWFKSPARSEWKLGPWDEPVDLSSSAREIIKQEYGLREPEWCYRVGRRQYRDGDWILNFKLKRRSPSQHKWMFVDRILPMPRSDKAYDPELPCELVQLYPSKTYSGLPFRIDKRFRRAFSKASRICTLKSNRPSSRLVVLINKYYAKS